MTTTVRVSDETHARLAALSAATGRRMQTIVEDAVGAYERDQFWQAFEASDTEIAEDAQAWAEEQAEREAEAAVLADGLD
jgi:predicted DNA-binding protein